MLDELTVRNLGLIAEARLEPGPGLVVVTGETGAGKTLLLGGLRLLAGGPARKELVGPAGDEASVQARFTFEGTETTVGRRITATGRTKAYVDGLMTPVKAVEKATAGAVEIVAQHDHLQLARSSHLRTLIDTVLDDDGAADRMAYAEAFEKHADIVARQRALGGDRRALERELATVRHHAGEIDAASFTAGEDVELEATVRRMRNAREIIEGLQVAAAALGEEGVEGPLDTAVSALEKVAVLDPAHADLATQAADLASLVAELRAGATAAADLDLDPARLEAVEQRLAALGDLRRKYGSTLDEVLDFGREAARRGAELTGLLAESDSIDVQRGQAEESLISAGVRLTEARRRAARALTGRCIVHLEELGFTEPVVEFSFSGVAAGPTGCDRVEMRFASHRSLDPAPVSRIASGGELSRLVLSLRLAAGSGHSSVAAFDEIDAGVGGTVALALGRKLAGLAESCQVLCVTHLPQVAAHADTHYVVERVGNVATVRPVTGAARLEELSRMLAGLPGSERGREHAAELLRVAAASG